MGGLEHRHLRSALEFAVLIAAEGQKRKPPLDFPRELRPHLGATRIPAGSLGRIRRAIEADDTFRTRLAAGALPELVDEVGRLWLERPDGWERRALELVAAAEAADAERDLAQRLKRAERQRHAAEQAAARTRVELVARDDEIASLGARIDELTADVDKLVDRTAELRAELTDTRNEVRHARDRERAALARRDEAEQRLGAAERGLAEAEQERREATAVRDDALAARAEAVASVAEITAAAEEAQTLADRLRSLLPVAETAPTHRRATRTPLPLPGGILSTSVDAAEFFVRSDAAVVIDGYNVSMAAWPERPLAEQRTALLDLCENVARRHGTDIAVFFDGAAVVGAHTTRRRLVRVAYSPDGVIADDLIRDEVRRLPSTRPVVVVTDDREIVRDVRADGANTLPGQAFLGLT